MEESLVNPFQNSEINQIPGESERNLDEELEQNPGGETKKMTIFKKKNQN
jgi:hypothetical protein